MFSNLRGLPTAREQAKARLKQDGYDKTVPHAVRFLMVIMVEQTRQALRQCVELLIIYVPIVAHHSTMVCMVANSKAHNSHQRNAFVQETAKQTHNTTWRYKVQMPQRM